MLQKSLPHGFIVNYLNFKNGNINNINLRNKYKEYSISECSRWRIDRKYYIEMIDKCDYAIFITYKPLNYHEEQVASFVLGNMNEHLVLQIPLVCSKEFFELGFSPSFGLLLIGELIKYTKCESLIIIGVNNDTINYYTHNGFNICSVETSNNEYTMMPSDVNISSFLNKITIYTNNKLNMLNEMLNNSPEKRNSMFYSA